MRKGVSVGRAEGFREERTQDLWWGKKKAAHVGKAERPREEQWRVQSWGTRQSDLCL